MKIYKIFDRIGPIYRFKIFLVNIYVIRNWKKQGCPVPPPHIIKERTIKEYAKKYSTDILVETGTASGDMIHAMRNSFRQLYSIELSKELYKKALIRFAGKDHIHLIQGDSAKKIVEVLNQVTKPCLFWLDGHYSGSGTAKADIETPIIEELSHIFSHKIKNHVILIDDARCFTGENDYPTIDELKAYVKKQSQDYVFEVNNDIIRIHL